MVQSDQGSGDARFYELGQGSFACFEWSYGEDETTRRTLFSTSGGNGGGRGGSGDFSLDRWAGRSRAIAIARG